MDRGDGGQTDLDAGPVSSGEPQERPDALYEIWRLGQEFRALLKETGVTDEELMDDLGWSESERKNLLD